MTTDVPPFVKSEELFVPKLTRGLVIVNFAVPSACTMKLFILRQQRSRKDGQKLVTMEKRQAQ